ncbi:MAG: hypothetical protein LBD07_02205 [Spirochaetaceae bacterium]|jgi:hypothetical protein|nr:hypothetical protein [Spirochaetaceae bacterium]
MCPSKNILSIYFDGELPSPFKEKMKDHIGSCKSCAKVISGFAGLSGGLHEPPEQNLETAQVRIWKKFQDRIKQGRNVRQSILARRSFWRREVRLPMPVAITAGLTAVFTFALLLVQVSGGNRQPLSGIEGGNIISIPEEAAYKDNPPSMLNTSNIKDVLQFLEDDGDSDSVIIRLPERGSFNRYGGPRLINASSRPGRSAEP